MFKNFITLAFRHFVRSPLTSSIELFGLTAAFTVSILVLMWVHNELTYDKFNENYDRIYRLEGGTETLPLTASVSLPEMRLYENLPGVEKMVMIGHVNNRISCLNEENDSRDYFDLDYLYVNQAIIDVFTVKFIQGNPSTALQEANQVVLTEQLAETMFGTTDILGKVIFDQNGESCIVTGVIQDIPNSHLKFEALFSLATQTNRFEKESWTRIRHNAFVLLNDGADIRGLEEEMGKVYDVHAPREMIEKWPGPYSSLRPLSEVYFGGKGIADNGYSKYGDIHQITAFTSIIALCLVLACMNFIRLRSAKSMERIQEIAIKKVSGASRRSIFIQLLGEVAVIVLIALIIALVFSHSLLTYFNSLMGSMVAFDMLLSPTILSSLLLGLVLICLLSGGLPAVYASSFRPVIALKGLPKGQSNRKYNKQLSLIALFSLTMILLIGLTTIVYQLKFMKDTDVGFDPEGVITFKGLWRVDKTDTELLRDRLLSHPSITTVSTGFGASPGDEWSISDGGTTVRFDGSDHKLVLCDVDEYYGTLLDLEVLEGRMFSENGPNDKVNIDEPIAVQNVVINETAAGLIGVEDPVDAMGNIVHNNQKIRIVGVLKDFHINATNTKIQPMLFRCTDSHGQFIVKMSKGNMPETLRYVEEETEKVLGRIPEIQFVEDRFQGQYSRDDNFAKLVSYLTILIVVISGMGLLGIFIQSIKVRTKEVGIRKILGASLIQVVGLLSGSILKTIAIASIIAIPVGSWVMNQWLADYPYHIEMHWTIYAIAIGATLLIAAMTVGWQCWRASNTNPSRLIRYE